MVKIDYSKLKYKKTPSLNGHSVENVFYPDKHNITIRGNYEENSFYLQKSKTTPGRYRPYYEYDTSGSIIPMIGSQEQELEEKGPTLTRTLKK